LRTDVLLSPFDATVGGLREAATAADELGIEGLWTMDHLTGTVHEGRKTVLESLLSMAVMADATERCRIGPLVLNAVLRPPALLAQSLAGLYELAEGRLIVGLGAGGGGGGDYGAELSAAGLVDHRPGVRRQRCSETVEILRHLWSGSDESWSGELHQLGGGTGFAAIELPPPIVIGGYGPKMATLAGKLADGFNTVATHPELRQLLTVARSAAAVSSRSEPFESSVYARYDPLWLDPDSDERQRLTDAGVDTLILILQAPHDLDVLERIGRP
jgi:alkanesulfonate monooxygenase SsuD/methylene tetrahydromethanopterin reductase-like flavin-dependent oxidoreductase (luciferase family)